VLAAREKERKRRRAAAGPLGLPPGAPVLVPGLCLPKALAPVLPIYLQGVLQVRARARGYVSPRSCHCKWHLNFCVHCP
jgi:hypothetical protein